MSSKNSMHACPCTCVCTGMHTCASVWGLCMSVRGGGCACLCVVCQCANICDVRRSRRDRQHGTSLLGLAPCSAAKAGAVS